MCPIISFRAICGFTFGPQKTLNEGFLLQMSPSQLCKLFLVKAESRKVKKKKTKENKDLPLCNFLRGQRPRAIAHTSTNEVGSQQAPRCTSNTLCTRLNSISHQQNVENWKAPPPLTSAAPSEAPQQQVEESSSTQVRASTLTQGRLDTLLSLHIHKHSVALDC